ncbi:MAG: Rne/Rng family ribonuclease [Acidobacteria bacterium]|nr:Rne/Rng family ribonuclease [Acidobacteriota bacterium]
MDVRKSLVVNATPLETRIALLENGQLCELFVERTRSKSQVGDVYKGRVAKILPGMQSAFVGIGGAKDGFLYLDDPVSQRLAAAGLAPEDAPEGEVSENEEGGVEEELPPAPAPLPKVREGDEVLVQVVKDPIGTKGPRLSRHLSFPGRFLVFMPGIDHIGISRKITDPEERERLRALIKSHSQPGEGFIVRTAAIGEKDEDLVGDVAFLRQLWTEVQATAAKTPAQALVWQDLRLLHKVLRDIFREEVASFWVDDASVHGEVVEFIAKLHPEWVDRVRHFTSDLPIFDAFGIEAEIEAARHPKVFLKHGGSIVLNQTEALVSVDVNTGKFVGKKDLEETVYHANLEAIPEIIRQLRLRNLGGIVVVDFIDMLVPEHREAVLARLQDELKRDRNHARATGISEFGLVEMTRKRTGPSLERMLTQPCPSCSGTGRLPSAETVLLKAYRELVRQGRKLEGAVVTLRVHADDLDALQTEAKGGLTDLAKLLGATLAWTAVPDQARHTVKLEIATDSAVHPKQVLQR